MSSTIYTPNSSSQTTSASTTDKIRIATTSSAIAIAIGNANVTANLTACMIIPANSVNNDVYVGQGSYIAYINVTEPAGVFSITTRGAPHAITGTE